MAQAISSPPPFVTVVTRPDGVREMHYHLHTGQQAALDSTARFTLVLAGSQAGKTVIGPVWINAKMQERGPGDYLAASASYDLLRLKMLPALRDHFLRQKGWKYYAGDRIFALGDDYRLILRSAEADGGLESSTALAAWPDEWGQPAVTINRWEALVRRTAVAMGPILLTTTPYDWNWLKTEVYDRWAAGDPDYNVINFRSIDNPAFPEAEWDRAKRTMPAWRFDMMHSGLFTRPAGQILVDFDESVHRVKTFTIPSDWTKRKLGLDFGMVHAAEIWAAQDPKTHSWYVYRESMGPGTSGQHAAGILEYKEPAETWGGGPSEDGLRLEYQIAGVPVAKPLILDVEASLDRVDALFLQRRLFVMEHCTGLLGEIKTYSRELDAAGYPTSKIRDKEKFHRIDALRYLCGAIQVDAKLPKAEEQRAPTRGELLDQRTRKPKTPRIAIDDYA